MRKLYLKIVLSIWTVMIVTAISAHFIVSNLTPEDSRLDRRFGPQLDRMSEFIAVAAMSRSEGLGEQGLIDWFGTDPMAQRLPGLALLNEQGDALIRRGDIEPSAGNEIRGRFGFEHDGRSYTLVTAPPGRPGHGRFSRPRDLRRTIGMLATQPKYRLLLLAIAVSLSVILSILLARYLVRPLTAFEAAGRKLAAGNLGVRVASSLGNRGDEIADFAATFDFMASRIEALVQSHKELLRDVSHELRSPLARAHAALSLARQQTNGVVDGELDRIEHEIERLNGMIGKLLVYSRLDANQFQVHMESIDLSGFLKDLVGDAQIEADAEGKSVVLAECDRTEILADPELLSSAFENILRNAIRHTPACGRVDVSIRRSAAEPNKVVVRVRDFGAGVNERDLEKIFRPFYKSDDGFAGSGIGLAIARQSIIVHGGETSAANAPDGGLLVTVTLPAI